MKTCIICRELRSHFNDEHVIPDSIGGHYHIYTVCTNCNSKMGLAIDSTLSNHKFIEFYRHQNNIRGKSGSIPNPFQGTQSLKDDPEQKVRTDTDANGRLIPKLLPKIVISKNNNELESFSVTIDGRDTKELDRIVDSVLARNGIDRNLIETSTSQEEIRPIIQGRFKVDTHRFKMAMLKIAYEFAVDKIPEYFEDEQARVISDVLLKADFENLNTRVTLLGSGLDKSIQRPYEKIVNFKDGNHYLILFSSPLGLVCTVSIFGILSISIKLSSQTHYLDSGLLILKNDIIARCAELFDMKKISSKIYGPTTYHFAYKFANRAAYEEFYKNEIHSDFSFYFTDTGYPLFDKNNNIIYNHLEDKLIQTQLNQTVVNEEDFIMTNYLLDEDLYIKVLPLNKYFQVIEIGAKRNRIGTI
jgi:hypothetical protein